MSAGEPETLGQARRAVASAGALWADGLVPEAHGYMATALRAALTSWTSADTAAGGTSQEQAVEALGKAGYPHLDRLREALAATVEPASPGAAPPKDFERIWAEAERLINFSGRRLRSPAARKQARRRVAVGLGAGFVLAILFLVRLWTGPQATASAVIGSDFPAAHAVDGSEGTEWILPDRTPGWLEVTFRSPRRVRSVRLVNGHNRQYMDRGAQQVRVVAFSAKGPAGTAAGQFPNITEKRSAIELPLAAEDVTHLRIEVLTYFGSGGSLAEVEVR